MGVAAYWHFKEVPPSWAAFGKVLEDRFMPSDIKNRLTEEFGRLKMDGNDFNRYFSQFQVYCQHIQTTDESMLVMIFVWGLWITLQHAVQLARPATLMEAYESAWKAHLGPAPPWKAYIEKTRHEDMERLKTAMCGELEAFSHQAGNFITRSHSEFIRQQEEKYAARAKTPPTEGSSACEISEPEEEVFYGPTLQRLPAPPPPPTSSSWNFQHRTAPVQLNTTPQRPPSPLSIDASTYRDFNGRGDDGGPRWYSGRYNR